MRDLLISFLTTVLGSGASFAALRIFFDHRKDKQARHDALGYLSIQLAFYFEAYAFDCARTIADNQNAGEHEGHVGKFIDEILQPPPLPTSNAFQFLEPTILNQVFSFAQRRQMAQEAASSG